MTTQSKHKTSRNCKTAAAKSDSPAESESSNDRAALVKRMWRAADAQVREIEHRLSRDAPRPLDRERDARVLAVLAKTLRELSALDESKQSKRTIAPADDDAVPRDMGELRRSLARKLEALVAGRGADIPDEP